MNKTPACDLGTLYQVNKQGTNTPDSLVMIRKLLSSPEKPLALTNTDKIEEVEQGILGN